jgi:hypothetical protein
VKLGALFCSHLWDEVHDGRAKAGVKDTAMIINFKDVRCRKCGKETRMGRQQYVQHLIETKRFGA